MDNNLAQILGSAGLPQEMVTELQEAFNTKVEAAKAETELSLRDEFSRRYQHDKTVMVEAMESMIDDALTKYAADQSEELTKLSEARARFEAAVAESKAHYKKQLKEHVNIARNFAVDKLAEEAKALRASRVSLDEARTNMAAELSSLKESVAADRAAHVKKIDEFVVRQISNELAEFQQDKDALIETRLKLVTEAKARLAETQRKFVKESAAKIEAFINETLSEEIKQLHEDIERNRKNNFGARMIETFAAEFMTSYLSEGTEVRKVTELLAATKSQLAESQAKLEESAARAERAERKAMLAEDRAERTAIMTELLSPLKGEKREAMEGMLATIKTSKLRESYKKYLPVVVDGEGRKSAQKTKLSEGKTTTKTTVAVTGNTVNRLSESAQAERAATEDEGQSAVAEVVRLAGIK